MAEMCFTGRGVSEKVRTHGNYNWYFSLTQDGKPIIEPYNIFSYTFATMAFGQLSKASGNQEYAI